VQKRLSDDEFASRLAFDTSPGNLTNDWPDWLEDEARRARESEAQLLKALADLYEAAVLLDSGGYKKTVGIAINAAKAALAGAEEP
jgi:hypothetical protein